MVAPRLPLRSDEDKLEEIVNALKYVAQRCGIEDVHQWDDESLVNRVLMLTRELNRVIG